MKVALLTIWHELNYGAELQAYATIKAIQKLGHEVEMIDIRLSDCEYKNFKGKIVTSLSSIGPCQKKFESFWDKYIPKTHRYTTIEQLKENPPIADIYMVGSDQVWNPQITGAFSKLFFLDFGSENIRRVSFASSFGVNQWKYPELQEDIKKLLSRFHMISCRESSGVDILKKTFGLDASLVLDPTLLFSSWNAIVYTTLHFVYLFPCLMEIGFHGFWQLALCCQFLQFLYKVFYRIFRTIHVVKILTGSPMNGVIISYIFSE